MIEATSSIPILALTGLEGNAPTALSPLQVFLASQFDTIAAFWWTISVIVLLTVVIRAFSAIHKQFPQGDR
ncbi:MAG: hypothetical protein HYS26_01140 [Candidatus Kaiserbacteria bacterium]|nr:MAG: hypothetical protein HYS26_01140 [Candidatus Kaiserbacteria bacterium]